MEPRWRRKWLDITRIEGRQLTYLGGTNKLDMWHDGSAHIDVVWGESTDNWIWGSACGDTLTLDRKTVFHSNLVDTPTEAELAEAYAYLQLFAPWVLEKKDGA